MPGGREKNLIGYVVTEGSLTRQSSVQRGPERLQRRVPRPCAGQLCVPALVRSLFEALYPSEEGVALPKLIYNGGFGYVEI